MASHSFLFTLLFVLLLVTPLKAQQDNEDFYHSMADNLCEHLDSLGDISVDGFIPFFLQMELGDLSSYLPEEQQDSLTQWGENSFFPLPFLKNESGNKVVAYLIESCPEAGNRLFSQVHQMKGDSAEIDPVSFKLLSDFIASEVGPEALFQNQVVVQQFVDKGISSNPSVNAAYKALANSLGNEVLMELLMIKASQQVAGFSIRYFVELNDVKLIGESIKGDGLEGMIALIDTIKANDDIAVLCESVSQEIGTDFDYERPMYASVDEETKTLFRELHSGTSVSDAVLASVLQGIVMGGMLFECDAFKSGYREQLVKKTIAGLNPSPDEEEQLLTIADELCGCVALDEEKGRACFDVLMDKYGLPETVGTDADAVSPEQQRLMEAIITMLPGIAVGCKSF